MTSEWLQQCAAFTNGGTIPFWIRYQYKVNYIITGGTVASPVYGGWGPLDETVDKINAIPGLRILLPIQQFPQFMLRIDGTGKDVGYGDPTAVLPRWDDYARVSAVIAARYGNRMHMWQIGNEEYDIQAHNGAVLAPVFNAAYPAIKAHSSSDVIMGAVRKLPPGGTHVSTWMNNFVNYVPKISAGESPQAIPDGSDFHYYRDGSNITNNTNPAPDPATTDNSDNPGIAFIPSVQGEYTIIRPILDSLSPGIPIVNNEFGWDNSNNASVGTPGKINYPGTTPPWYVSRYTRNQMALSHFAGIARSQQFTIGQYTDAKSLHKQGLIDYTNYIAANPQFTPGAAPTAFLYCSVDRLDFEGGANNATLVQTASDQYFAIMNPTGSNKAWSVSNTQAWLTVSTIPTNGMKNHANEGLTSGTLTPGQCITLKAVVNLSGLSTLTVLTDTISVAVGGNTPTIAVNLWINPADTIPNITIDSHALAPTATVNGSNPAGQVVHIKNAGNYVHNWYGYTQASWLDISLSSGTLAAGATQAITITTDITGLAPGTYMESAYFCLTTFPTQYKNEDIPANTEYVNCLVNLKVTASTAPQVQLSTNAMYFTAGTGGATPSDQYFFINNCTHSAQDWTVVDGSYVGGGTGWLSFTPASGNNLPASGSTNGVPSPNQQSTDYKMIKTSVNSTALAVGTHTAVITATLGGTATQTIAVTYEVTSSSPTETLNANPTSVSATQVAGGAAVTATTTLTNSGNTTGDWTKVRTYTHGTGWLTITPGNGTLAAGASQVITFTCTPGSLVPDTYTATVVFNPSIGTSSATVNISFTVTAAPTPGAISANPLSVSATQVAGGTAVTATSTLSNTGGSSGSWTNSIAYVSGSGWLAVSPGSGTLAAGATQTATFTCTPGALAAGTYTANVTFTMGSTTAVVGVSFVVTASPSPAAIAASPTSVSTTQVQGGSAVTKTSTLSNTGGTSGSWTSSTTYTHGTGWLSFTPTSGTLAAGGATQVVTFTCSPGSLVPDTYTATVTFTMGSTTATVSISFIVTASTTPGVVTASPATLNFTDTFGQGAASPQSVRLTNTGGFSGTWTATITFKKGSSWMSLSASSGTLDVGVSTSVTVTLSDTSLAVGVYTGTITFAMNASTAPVAVTLIIYPAFVTAGSAQMTASDLATQYQRIMASIVGPQLSTLATTYYGGPNNNQVMYGELDALFPWESMSQLHVMKSINDVTAFLNAYTYTANVLSDNPIVYYRLSETSGISASDISGRNMTGTLSNTLGIISGVTLGQAGAIAASSDTAMLFDGSTGNITLPAGVTAANWSNLTVEVWIKPSNVTFTQTAFIVANDAPLSTNLGFMIAINKNAVIFRIGKTSSYYEINKAFTFAASTWYHLAGVFAGTSLTVYLNGNQLATTTVASALVAQTTNVVNIASKPGVTTNNFPGTLQHPALYKKALSSVRIQAHYLGATLGTTYMALVLADGAQAYYRLNETSGTTAFDSTANHYDATMTGTLTYSQVGIIGSDTAISFTATGELVMPAALGAGTWGAMSLEYWINIISGYQHIVIAGDASGTTIYLNGAVYTSGTGPDTVVVGPEVLYSGSLSAATLSQVSIYKYVLSAAQVANHFQVGSLGI